MPKICKLLRNRTKPTKHLLRKRLRKRIPISPNLRMRSRKRRRQQQTNLNPLPTKAPVMLMPVEEVPVRNLAKKVV